MGGGEGGGSQKHAPCQKRCGRRSCHAWVVLQAVAAGQGRRDRRRPPPLRGLPHRWHQLRARLQRGWACCCLLPLPDGGPPCPQRRAAEEGFNLLIMLASDVLILPGANLELPPPIHTHTHLSSLPWAQAASARAAASWPAARSCGCRWLRRWRPPCLATTAPTWTAAPACWVTQPARAASRVGGSGRGRGNGAGAACGGQAGPRAQHTGSGERAPGLLAKHRPPASACLPAVPQP